MAFKVRAGANKGRLKVRFGVCVASVRPAVWIWRVPSKGATDVLLCFRELHFLHPATAPTHTHRHLLSMRQAMIEVPGGLGRIKDGS